MYVCTVQCTHYFEGNERRVEPENELVKKKKTHFFEKLTLQTRPTFFLFPEQNYIQASKKQNSYKWIQTLHLYICVCMG